MIVARDAAEPRSEPSARVERELRADIDALDRRRRRLRDARWRRKLQPFLVASDLALVAAGFLALPVAPRPPSVVTYVVVLLTLACLGAYRSRLTLSVLDDLPSLASAAFVGTVAELVLRSLQGDDVAEPLLLQQALTVLVLLTVSRALAYVVVREARRRGVVQHRTLILGTGVIGRQIAEATLAHPESGLRVVGFLDDAHPDDTDVTAVLPLPLLGGYADLAHCIRREGVSEVIVAFGAHPGDGSGASAPHDAALVDALRDCDRMDCEIFCVPRFFELHHRSRDMDELRGTSLVRVRRATWRSGAWYVKRVLDRLLAALALVLLAPVMLVVAVAVRIEGGPGVLFRQERVGLDGVPFTMLKFRSLRLPTTPDGSSPWSINGDTRLGPVGRVIRATSLDELPQLVNILRGDMSIVGPRPERPEFVEEFTATIPRYTARHRAPAGLTGWAQVNGLRGDTSIEERARFDNYYIQNWSLWLDAKIIARTVSSVLLRRGS